VSVDHSDKSNKQQRLSIEFLATLIIIAFVVRICGGDDEDEKQALNAVPVKPTATNTTKSMDSRAVAKIQSTFRSMYSESLAYDDVDHLQVLGTTLVVKTSIFPDDEGHQAAMPICSLLSHMLETEVPQLGIDMIRVMGQGDNILAVRLNKDYACEVWK
jgi:hypothetical protein